MVKTDHFARLALKEEMTWSLGQRGRSQGFGLGEFPFLGRYFCSRMIRVSFEIGEKERPATGFLAPAIWFHRHKYGINLGKRRGIITLQYPAFIGSTIFIK